MVKQHIMSLPNIGYRLRIARKRSGLSREELAAHCRVQASNVARWENDLERPTRGQMALAAPVLNTTVAWLINEKEGEGPYAPWLAIQIPIFTLEYGSLSIEMLKRKQGGLIGYLYSNIQIGKKGFALRIEDDSMSPEFAKGDHVLIDPDVRPKPGNLVAAEVSGESGVLIRKYRLRSSPNETEPAIELKPHNDDWPTILIGPQNKGKVVGTVIEVRRAYRNLG